MNEYFILPQNYQFNNDLLLKALGICAVFLIAQPFIYAGVVKSLSGYISSLEVNQIILIVNDVNWLLNRPILHPHNSMPDSLIVLACGYVVSCWPNPLYIFMEKLQLQDPLYSQNSRYFSHSLNHISTVCCCDHASHVC